MTLSGTKTGNNVQNVNCAGIAVQQTLQFSGTGAPPWGITAPAAASGTMGSAGALTLGASATYAGTEKVAVYWTAAGVNYYRYDCAITSGTGTSFTVSSGTGTDLPSGGQAVLVATNQDVADGVYLTGNNLQQLVATLTQPGLVEWLNATPAQDRLSYLPASNSFDAWPSAAGVVAPPSGWTGSDVVVTLRFWNFSATAAVMQVGAILA